MSNLQQTCLRTLCKFFLPGRIKFAAHRELSPILALSVCNRYSRSSIEGPLYRWHGRLYLLTKNPHACPSKSETFIDLRWHHLDSETPTSPNPFEATYRGVLGMGNQDNIQTPQPWHKHNAFWSSTYLWALDFELGIPLKHWNHHGRNKCTLIASVTMGSEAKITHESVSHGDRAEGWFPQLQHKLPLAHVTG